MPGIEEGLPYAYRPLDPPLQRMHIRRRLALRYLLTLLVLGGFLVFGYLKYNSGPWASPTLGKSSLVSYWDSLASGWPIFGTPERPQRGRPTDPLKDDPLRQQPSSSSSPTSNQPFMVQPLGSKGGTKGSSRPVGRPRDNSLRALVTPFIEPKTLLMLVRMGLDQLAGLFMAAVVPILEAIVPRHHLALLEATFADLAAHRVSVHEAMGRSLLPMARTTGVAFLTLFPTLGVEVLDSLTYVLEGLHGFVEIANPRAALHYVSLGLSEWLVLLLRLGHHCVDQAADILDRFVLGLLPPNDVVDALDLLELLKNGQLPPWLPSYERLRDDALDTAKALAALKAQDAISSSFSAYMNPHVVKDGRDSADDNPLLNLASSMLGSMLNPKTSVKHDGSHADDDDRQKDENPLGDLATSVFSSFMSGSNADHKSAPHGKSVPASPIGDLASHLMHGFLKSHDEDDHLDAGHSTSPNSSTGDSVDEDPLGALLHSFSGSSRPSPPAAAKKKP